MKLKSKKVYCTYVNGEKAYMADDMQFAYYVQYKNNITLNDNAKMRLKKKYNVNINDAYQLSPNLIRVPLT